jgi:hypothetical protein
MDVRFLIQAAHQRKKLFLPRGRRQRILFRIDSAGGTVFFLMGHIGSGRGIIPNQNDCKARNNPLLLQFCRLGGCFCAGFGCYGFSVDNLCHLLFLL